MKNMIENLKIEYIYHVENVNIRDFINNKTVFVALLSRSGLLDKLLCTEISRKRIRIQF